MGGHAAFVWPAYAVSALGLGGLAFFIWRRDSRVRARLRALEERRAENPRGEA
ncbi:heme exporter protein CcmD [Amphiplicatus metriothermophilus]|uniref:Heme exporter protein D n=2 Tax=Amphiplicatus metriothermophilus TaxID=1519374 RepID=A0A239PQY9_9PROT|nr:heme exporter protein CcmD [Amphiplicatus metriothermophilus]